MTTAPDDTPAPPRRLRRATGSVLATSALLVGVAACASEADDAASDDTDVVATGEFAATAAYLHSAAEQSASEGYRLEVMFSMTSDDVDEGAPPLITGEIDGEAYHMLIDLGPMMTEMADVMGEALPSELAGTDLTMEMAGDPEQLYLRAPMFASLGGPSEPGAAGELAALGDGWGHIDVEELGDLVPGDLAAALGGQVIDPQAVVDMIQDAGDVEDLGEGDVRGTAVHGLSAEVAMADLIEASGQNPDDIAGVDEATTELYDMTTAIEVWIDDDGYLRRMAFGYSMDDIAAAMGEDAGEFDQLGLGDMRFSYLMDMFDYGTAVDFEPPADTIDITDAYAALLQE